MSGEAPRTNRSSSASQAWFLRWTHASAQCSAVKRQQEGERRSREGATAHFFTPSTVYATTGKTAVQHPFCRFFSKAIAKFNFTAVETLATVAQIRS